MTTSLDLTALIANPARAEVVPVEMVGVLLAQPRAAAPGTPSDQGEFAA